MQNAEKLGREEGGSEAVRVLVSEGNEQIVS